jgi:release factor glutamine methyltransferase
VAADLDPVEVRRARRNLAGLGAVYEGDLFEPLPGELEGRVDVLVVNAPYVPTDEIALMPPEARDHEPAIALDGGPDGLDLHRRVAAGAARWLTPGGSVVIEVSVPQAPTSAALFAAEGFAVRIAHSDELDGTAVIATRAAAP